MKKILVIMLTLLVLGIPKVSKAVVTSSSVSNDLKVYVYYTENCSKCDEEKNLITSLTSEFPRISLEYLNINDLPEQAKNLLKIKTNKLPVTIIGSTVFYGFNTGIEKELREALQSYSTSDSFCNIMTKLDNEEDVKACIEENKKIYQKHTKSIFTFGVTGILIVVIIAAACVKLRKKN